METTYNTLKKILYKENPKALLQYIYQGNARYVCICSFGTIGFCIPANDMGSARFYPEMEAKFLIRWIDVLPDNLDAMLAERSK